MPVVKDHGRKDIEPLPPVDHSQIAYPEFCKEFYTEPPELTNLTTEQVNARRRKLDIKVTALCAYATCNCS